MSALETIEQCLERLFNGADLTDYGRDEILEVLRASHTSEAIRREAREHLEWALDEIDTLSNKLVQFAYPQGATMAGREDQAERYVAARQHVRALSPPVG